MNSRILALLATSIATIIYGVTFTVAKDVMPVYLKPFGFIVLRVGGAAILFWSIGFFIKKQAIEKKDFKRIVIASFFGIALNMLTFFKGLSYTTPISASVMMLTAPILVLVFASLILKERLFFKKVLGVVIGLVGAVILILYGNAGEEGAKSMMLGNLLVFINAASYGLFLVIVRDIIQKYNPIIFVKWLYLFGFFMVLPFGWNEIIIAKWSSMTFSIYSKIGFVIVFSTCVTYLFNLFALSKLKPTTVSVFIYLQPVVATIYALMVGSDSLNTVKIIATILIFTGVYLVTIQGKETTDK